MDLADQVAIRFAESFANTVFGVLACGCIVGILALLLGVVRTRKPLDMVAAEPRGLPRGARSDRLELPPWVQFRGTSTEDIGSGRRAFVAAARAGIVSRSSSRT